MFKTFLERFKFKTKLRWGCRNFLCIPYSHALMATPITSIPSLEAAFLKIDKPALTSHHPSNPIVATGVHSLCGTFCGFAQMFSDMSLSLQYHTECFHLPKNPLCSICSSPPPLMPSNHWSFYCLLSFFLVLSFPECRIIGIMQYECSLFRVASFT